MHCSRTVLATFATLVALGALSLPAAAALHVDGKPKVSFYADGSPGALSIEGKTTDLSMTDDGTTVTVVVELENLSTGIDLRDHHMKEKYMEVGTYPSATLRFARADLQLPTETGKSTNGTLAGTFNCHGVDAPTTVTYAIKKSKTGYVVDASLTYDTSKHGIEIPSYLGITIDPVQKVRARFSMVDE